MTVTMNSSAMRADFMISDAALPQRIAELAEEQSGAFAELLSGIGDAKGELAAELTQTAQKYSDMEEAGEAVIYRDKETGLPLPDDPRKLVKLVLSGKVKLGNVPEELITPEFIKLLMLMSKAKEFGNYEEEDEDDNSYLTEAIAAEQNFQQEISYMMLREFYEIIEKHNERESEDKVTMLDGISEPIDEDEALPSILTAEEHSEADEGLFTELVDNLVETVSEELEKVGEAVSENVVPNTDVFVPSGRSEARDVSLDADIAQTAEPTKAEAPVQAAVSRSEQTAETAARQTIPIEEFTVRTLKTEKPEIAENAVRQEGEEPIVVKVVTRNENAQRLDKTAEEAPKAYETRTERVKSATEELEMLRNAKAKTAKPAEEEFEVKPEHTANPLNADQPIVLRKADGSEIEVRPSEVVRQTAKLVEKAVSENGDKTEYSLVLNPEELGKITVKLTKAADGAVSVTIAAENARTQRILEEHSSLMQSNLRSNGVNLESWQTVNESRQETLAQDYNGSSKNPYYRNDDGGAEESSDDKSFADIIASM